MAEAVTVGNARSRPVRRRSSRDAPRCRRASPGFSWLFLPPFAAGDDRTPELLQHWTTAGSALGPLATPCAATNLIDPRLNQDTGPLDSRSFGTTSPKRTGSARAGILERRASPLDLRRRRHVVARWPRAPVQSLRGICAPDPECQPRAKATFAAVLGTLALLAGLIHEAMTRDACQATAQEHARMS